MRVALLVSSLLMVPLSLSAAEKLKVVTSFSILADMAHQVGGEYVQVVSLVGPDQDAQGYKPTNDDAKKLAQANVIIQNGLGYELGSTGCLRAVAPRNQWSRPATASHLVQWTWTVRP